MIESDARTGELRLHLAMTAIEPNKLFTTFVVSRKFPNLLSISDPFYSYRRGSSMPVLSYLHQLFNTDQCHAYIHTLRWKERPLQCPRCQSQDVDPWGKYRYRPGCKRYWCNGCKRTFNDLTNTMMHQSKRSLPHWVLATFLLCLACSSRRIAREVGVHIRTSYRWCWWLRNAALSYEMHRQLEGTVEADDLYHTAGNKGQGAKADANSRVDARRLEYLLLRVNLRAGSSSSGIVQGSIRCKSGGQE